MPTSVPLTADAPGLATARDSGVSRWRFSFLAWGAVAFALLVTFIPYYNVLGGLYQIWNVQPEYSHGILIPWISLFLIWRQRDALARTQFVGSWTGLAVMIGGVLLWFLAELSTIYVVGQYSFLVELCGVVLALGGAALMRILAMPIGMLLLMIPLPAFFYGPLSLKLQLLSSALGVAVIRLFGISVYLEGNVIDLGSMQLQVVEACNGLRYLFPLMTLAFLVAYFFKVPLWKRVLLVVASIPTAVLMNSLRIGLIGVTVEYWGRRAAEGLLHDFEGWVVFMSSGAVLLGFAAVLVRIGNRGARLRDALTLDFGPSPPKDAVSQPRSLPISFVATTVCATLVAVGSFMMPDRVEIHPHRATFAEFPAGLGAWEASRSAVAPEYLETLKLDDYLLADFYRASALPVNVWIAYYDSQRSGQSTHSPKSCLPGGGWEFQSLTTRELRPAGSPLTINRGLIRNTNDGQRAIIYYWFQQRGRDVTNEYMVKWYIFQDALTRNRTDGALVRLMVPLPPSITEAEGDRQLAQFAGLLTKQLPQYVPN
jgi:exosortase D (VPLPA-CTERM-specific)